MDFQTAVATLCSDDWEAGARGTRQREDVLSALLPASRTQDGRLALGASPGAIESIAWVLRDRFVFLERSGLLAVRLLRNLCARSLPNQQRAAGVGAHLLVLEAIRSRVEDCGGGMEAGETPGRVPAALRRIEGDDGAVSAGRLRLPFFSAAVEFLCNFATCNAANANLVWDRAFPELFFDMLECDNAAAAAAAAALLHNCIAATPERASDVVRIWTEEGGRGCGRSIAGIVVGTLHGEQEKDAEGAGKKGDQFSWAFMVIRRLVTAGLVEGVFNVVGPPLNEIVTVEGAAFSPYQMTLLGVLEAAASESAENFGKRTGIELAVPDASLSFFARLTNAAWGERDGTAFRLACNIAGALVLLATDQDNVAEMKRATTADAVQALVSLHLEEERRGGAGAEGASDEKEAVAGLRGAAVRLVALASDRDREVQDLVRDMQGILPILSSLSYEKDVSVNPFLREWAVLAIRNLCCGNQENADQISQLELLDVQAKDGVLEQAGLEPFMDEHGKPRVRVKR